MLFDKNILGLNLKEGQPAEPHLIRRFLDPVALPYLRVMEAKSLALVGKIYSQWRQGATERRASHSQAASGRSGDCPNKGPLPPLFPELFKYRRRSG